MANALMQAGAQPKGGGSNWAPIFSNEFFSGLYTNRNPLRDPATPFISSKFYSATRYEALWNGANIEITPRLTLGRAPGHSVFNASSFPAIKDFYSYHISGANKANSINVVVDTTTGGANNYGAVYNATPNVIGGTGKVKLFDKAVGAGQTRFLAVGNTLYMGDGVDLFQYLTSSYDWQASYSMPAGAFIVDAALNVQRALGYTIPCTNIAISGGVLTASVSFVTNLTVGGQVTLEGMQSSFLNGVVLTITSIGTGMFTAAYEANDLTESETGYVVIPSVNGTLGNTLPTFNDTLNGLTLDGTNLWQQTGPALRVWGIPQPVGQATAQNTVNTSIAAAWEASTYYMPSPYIYVGSHIYKLTTVGTTNASVPTFNTGSGSTTTDGTAVWTEDGATGRVINNPYTLGNVILVTWEVTTTVNTGQTIIGYNKFGQPIYGPGSYSVTTTYSAFFQCTVPGMSSGSANDLLSWTNSLGSTVIDGGVTWTNIGIAVTRTSSATAAPSFASNVQQPGNIGNTQLVTNISQILDSNGAVEEVLTPGESSTTEPTWPTTTSGTVVDGASTKTFTWSNVGNSPAVGGSAAGTASWVYSYAYMDLITGSVGPATPISLPITLAADSFIQVQGKYTTLNSIGMINIYRSTQGQTVPFLIGQVPNNGTSGTWTYNDFSPDQGNPGSTMNNLIEADLVGGNAPPPAGFLPSCLHLSAIWGYVNNLLYYSQGGGVVNMQGGFEAFPSTQYVAFQSQGVVAWGTGSGLYAILVDGIQLVSGTSAPFSVSDVLDLGILSPNCFTLNGQDPFLFTSDRQIISLDPTSGVTVDGFPIADILASSSFDPETAYLTWYVNGTDQRLICGDGSTGYYTMLNNISPEPPAAVWSTKRAVVGGCSAIKSVETFPGVFQMLVGPASEGPILFRDTTAAQDNGVSYPAWVMIGSNVLAHPGQIAEIGFIHVDAKRVGSVPTLGVLMGEVYGYPGCPPVDTLNKVVNDPPRQPESQSTYSRRYYLSQTGKPAWCRHMQLLVSFGTENALNELMSFTIFGAIHVERASGGA